VIDCDNSNVRTVDAEDYTCLTFLARPYYVVEVGDSLMPGATVNKGFLLSNPDLDEFTLKGRLFAGPGTP